jgi:hypothetical protein
MATKPLRRAAGPVRSFDRVLEVTRRRPQPSIRDAWDVIEKTKI